MRIVSNSLNEGKAASVISELLMICLSKFYNLLTVSKEPSQKRTTPVSGVRGVKATLFQIRIALSLN